MSSYKIVQKQFSHIATDTIPYTMHFEEALKNKMIENLKTSDWQKCINNSIIAVGHYDTWSTMIKQEDNTLIDAYGSVWNQTYDIAHLKTPILDSISLDKYKFPKLDDFRSSSIFDNMEKS